MKRDQEAEIVYALRHSPERFDAGETAFIARELLAIKQKLYETDYPTLVAKTLIPIASDVDPYAEALVYQQTDSVGKAKIVANDATDLPRVETIVAEAQTPIKTIADEYKYSWMDLKRAARSRVGIVDRKAKGARQRIEEGIDYALAIGDAATGLVGFTNNSNVHVGAAAASWTTATPAQMYADMQAAVNLILVNTKGKRRATDLVLPVSSYATAQTTPWSSTGNSNLTVLAFFQANNPGLTITPWYELETAGASGVKRMIAFQKDEDVLEGIVPLDFYELTPQPTILAIVVPCVARVGGVQVRFPKAIEYVDGL